MHELPLAESLSVEFKRDLDRLHDETLVEEVVAMANTHGGEIYLGVEDNGTATGLHKTHRDIIRLAAMIGNKTRPSVAVRIDTLIAGDVHVARIAVPPAPGSLIATISGKVLRRRIKHDGLPEVVPIYPYEYPRFLANMGAFDLTDQPAAGAGSNDLDPLERERLRQTIRKYNGDLSLLSLTDDELDVAMGLALPAHGEHIPTITGLLLIGREENLRRLVPAHEVMFQVLSGTSVRLNESFRSPLLRLFDTLLERFRARNEEKEINVGLFRVPVPDFDEQAFREALVNALSHRDYTMLGATQVQLTSDGLSISNPGGFIEGVTIENLLDAPPRSRNPRLADALKRVGLAERTGRGVDRIFQGMLRYGRPEPDYSSTTSASVTVNLLRAKADISFLRMILEAEQRQGGPLRVTELLALTHLREERRLKTVDLVQVLHRHESATRALMERLVEDGLVEAHGAGRGRSYTLSARVYGAEGKRVEYTRQVGLETDQIEQLILKHVKSHGSIKRAEVMALGNLNGSQAYRLLKRMMEEGKLAQHSSKRYAYYTRGNS